MRILVTGLIGQYAFGGVTWDYLQYVLGFQKLGHEVWYLEDTATWAYDPIKQEPSADCSYNVNYLSRIMSEFGLGDRWIYRNEADGSYHGVSDVQQAEKIIRESDVLANVSGACWLREVTASIPYKLFLDGDPMFTHIGLALGTKKDYVDRVRAHTDHFSFGLNIGAKNCFVPTVGLRWKPTVQPIALEYWESKEENKNHPAYGAFTTVMNWASYKLQEFQGESYGQKDMEFLRFMDLPQKISPERMVLAMGQGVGQRRPTSELEKKGWKILEPDQVLPDYQTYRDFLRNSKAEWSIAKNGYVKSWSGWFSCRSACYLALGRPVVVQDTGWSEHLPSGKGVLKFDTMEEAIDAIKKVSVNYAEHSHAARAFAETYFEAGKVCQKLLKDADIA
ncbi:MAG: glycosyltransferase family 1 protein [Verrucomicrobiae bacterium]|nr:glycosyltransferase family 1 protein [Verrucomicrobiae bacterium]